VNLKQVVDDDATYRGYSYGKDNENNDSLYGDKDVRRYARRLGDQKQAYSDPYYNSLGYYPGNNLYYPNYSYNYNYMYGMGLNSFGGWNYGFRYNYFTPGMMMGFGWSNCYMCGFGMPYGYG